MREEREHLGTGADGDGSGLGLGVPWPHVLERDRLPASLDWDLLLSSLCSEGGDVEGPTTAEVVMRSRESATWHGSLSHRRIGRSDELGHGRRPWTTERGGRGLPDGRSRTREEGRLRKGDRTTNARLHVVGELHRRRRVEGRSG